MELLISSHSHLQILFLINILWMCFFNLNLQTFIKKKLSKYEMKSGLGDTQSESDLLVARGVAVVRHLVFHGTQ